jgi:hypothetical protein
VADEKHPGGRPTVATPEVLAEAERYLAEKLWHPVEVIPTVEGLAVHLGIARSTLYLRDEFSDILENILSLQAKLLLNGSLKGELNPVISKMMLSAKHGYIEKSAKELTGEGGGPVRVVKIVDMSPDAADSDGE